MQRTWSPPNGHPATRDESHTPFVRLLLSRTGLEARPESQSGNENWKFETCSEVKMAPNVPPRAFYAAVFCETFGDL